VEAQQDAAADRQPARPPLTPEAAAVTSQRATLLLARTRAIAELQQACAAAHRAMLESAIADLDRRLAAAEGTEAEGTEGRSERVHNGETGERSRTDTRTNRRARPARVGGGRVAFMASGQPVISVDTRKKELVGD
jgi:hypothetical protein